MKKLPKDGQVWLLGKMQDPCVLCNVNGPTLEDAIGVCLDGSGTYDLAYIMSERKAEFRTEFVSDYYTKGPLKMIADLQAKVHDLSARLSISENSRARLKAVIQGQRDAADRVHKSTKEWNEFVRGFDV